MRCLQPLGDGLSAWLSGSERTRRLKQKRLPLPSPVPFLFPLPSPVPFLFLSQCLSLHHSLSLYTSLFFISISISVSISISSFTFDYVAINYHAWDCGNIGRVVGYAPYPDAANLKSMFAIASKYYCICLASRNCNSTWRRWISITIYNYLSFSLSPSL